MFQARQDTCGTCTWTLACEHCLIVGTSATSASFASFNLVTRQEECDHPASFSLSFARARVHAQNNMATEVNLQTALTHTTFLEKMVSFFLDTGRGIVPLALSTGGRVNSGNRTSQ